MNALVSGVAPADPAPSPDQELDAVMNLLGMVRPSDVQASPPATPVKARLPSPPRPQLTQEVFWSANVEGESWTLKLPSDITAQAVTEKLWAKVCVSKP